MNNNYVPILTIAGSDSGGCAGIQADIKAISACGGFAASAITATTAQNTQGVSDIHAIPIAHLAAQLDSVLTDIDFKAIKIGMLHSAEVINCVQHKLKMAENAQIVIDPVMISTSGDALINDEAIQRLGEFLPMATLITPNLPEAEVLLGKPIESHTQSSAATQLGEKFNTSVLLKGGHGTQDNITDVLYDHTHKACLQFSHPLVSTKHTHGTGCSLSSAIATYLGLGFALDEAVNKGIGYVQEAIRSGADKSLGKGRGPIDHFFKPRLA